MPIQETSIALRDVSLFQDLSFQELNEFRSCLREKSFQRGEMLFLEGDPCERIFIVQSGRVKIFRNSHSGKEQILEVLKPGETCACNPGSAEWSCSSSAQAMTDCRIWFFSRDNYIRLVKTNSKLAQSLNRIFAQRLCHFSSLIEGISLDNPQKRLVKFIIDMSESQEASSSAGRNSCISFTHEEIAQRLGLVRETVTRHLHSLKHKKLIDIKPQQIMILDLKGLRKLI